MTMVHLCYLIVSKRRNGISRYHISYGVCLQAVKYYIRKTGLTIENNSSVYLTKTLKVIYSGHKGALLYYVV